MVINTFSHRERSIKWRRFKSLYKIWVDENINSNESKTNALHYFPNCRVINFEQTLFKVSRDVLESCACWPFQFCILSIFFILILNNLFKHSFRKPKTNPQMFPRFRSPSSSSALLRINQHGLWEQPLNPKFFHLGEMSNKLCTNYPEDFHWIKQRIL